MFDIFISHSGNDKSSFVEPLVVELNKLGLCIWYDKDNINKGDNIKESIINGINESVIFVAIISNQYYQSNWANLELGILQAQYPNNFLSILFSDVKEFTAQKYPFLLNYSYIEADDSISNIANKLKNIVSQKKQERGLWHIEKTNLKSLSQEMYSYNNFKLEQLAIHLNRIIKNLSTNIIISLNEIMSILEFIFNDVATIENIFISSDVSILDLFCRMDFLGQNLKEHIKYLKRFHQEQTQKIYGNKIVEQESLYLIQFSCYSIIEWYINTYFKKPILKQKKLIPISPEEITYEDIMDSYEIEKLVLPPDLIATPSTVIQWHKHNPLTMIGARDLETGKLIGFFNTLPINDSLYEKIKGGDFDDTTIDIIDIRQYDIPGFYKLYLCSFCIHPAYNTTTAFKIIYTSFIDFLLNLAEEHEIYISEIIADGVTLKGTNLCENIGMHKVITSIHESNVYVASLIPPKYTTLKLNNKVGNKLLAHYQRMYNEYKALF